MQNGKPPVTTKTIIITTTMWCPVESTSSFSKPPVTHSSPGSALPVLISHPSFNRYLGCFQSLNRVNTICLIEINFKFRLAWPIIFTYSLLGLLPPRLGDLSCDLRPEIFARHGFSRQTRLDGSWFLNNQIKDIMILKFSLVIAAHPLCKFEAQEAITAPCCLSPMTLPGSSISSSSKSLSAICVITINHCHRSSSSSSTAAPAHPSI